MGWNPWAHLAEHWPHITVVVNRELPGTLWGLRVGDRIYLCRRLDQAARRSTLAHELGHLERGPVPDDPRGQAREERAVSALAARRLITISALIDGMRWTRDRDELAEMLWVDVPTLEARLDGLDPVEVSQMEHELEDEWIP